MKEEMALKPEVPKNPFHKVSIQKQKAHWVRTVKKQNKAFKTPHEEHLVKQTKSQILRGYSLVIKASDWDAEYLDAIPSLPLTSSMTLGKSINLSVLQILSRDSNNTTSYLPGLL